MTPATFGGRERRVLAAVADTFCPGVDDLAAAMERELVGLSRPALARQVALVLRALDAPPLALALAGSPRSFARLDRARREAALLRLADSPLPQLRAAFQALKRLALFLGYARGERNPLWAGTGYSRPDPLPLPDEPTELRATTAAPGEVIEADVCVIGSGAGGGVAAATCAADGRRVVVLESGPAWTEEALWPNEADGARFFLERGLATSDDVAIGILAGRAVGGGTLVNWCTSLRLPDDVRREWAIAGVELEDADFAAVERRLDVDTDESPRNAQNAALARGLDALAMAWQPIPRNVRGCLDCGHCGIGCRHGAKRSTARTYLADAVASGARIVAGCEARRVLVDRGRACGVEARAAGGTVLVRAPVVVLAGGAIGTSALLLRSGIGHAAGTGLHLHPTMATSGVYDEAIRFWSGVPQSVVSQEFARIDGAFGFRLEVPGALPGLAAAAFPWRGSAERRLIDRLDHVASFIAIVRDREAGRVRIDRDGEPIVDYRIRGSAAALCERAIVESADVHLAAGAEEVWTLHTDPVVVRRGGELRAFAAAVRARGVGPNRVGAFSAHQMGGAAMGASSDATADPDGAVRGARGVFVCDGSAFPSASGVNPMLTIMALARRNARRLLAIA